MATGIVTPEISTLVRENAKQAVPLPPPAPPLLPILLLLPLLLPSVDDIAGVALMAGAASSTARRGSLRSGVKPSAWADSSVTNASILEASILLHPRRLPFGGGALRRRALVAADMAGERGRIRAETLGRQLRGRMRLAVLPTVNLASRDVRSSARSLPVEASRPRTARSSVGPYAREDGSSQARSVGTYAREDGSSRTMATTNDKTASLFVTKAKFEVAAKDVGLSADVADALWTALGESSSQRIIAGATAPREDAANVNNWHWSEVDMLPWAKERLEQVCLGVEGKGVPDKGWVKVTKMEKCEGEASVSNRKGKRIVAFEIKVTCKWEGQVDYDDVSGELLLPYISEDVEDANDYEVKLTAKEPGDASHKKALKFLTAQLPTLREGLKAFKDEIHQK